MHSHRHSFDVGNRVRSPVLDGKRSSVATFSPSLPSTSYAIQDEFLAIQEKTFRKWLNAKLQANGIQEMTNLQTDLSDGVMLIVLMELMSGCSLGRYNQRPIMRVQKAENIQLALSFIRSRGVVLTNLGPEDIVDGNLKLILGLIWSLILRFTIADVQEEGKSAKDGLLLWCQRMTHDYEEVDVRDFTRSWSDGLAFCALIHKHRPDLLNYHALNHSDPHTNTKLAFKTIEQALHIPQLLDVSDIVDVPKPDERSIITYIAEIFLALTTAEQSESSSRRIVNFAEIAQSIWTSRNDYERRAGELIRVIRKVMEGWRGHLSANYGEAMEERKGFVRHKSERRKWKEEKTGVESLLGNILTKLKTYNMKLYVPPEGLALSDIDTIWSLLLTAEAERSRAINDNMRSIKEQLRKSYARSANDIAGKIAGLSLSLAELDGSLELQQRRVHDLGRGLPRLAQDLPTLQALEAACDEAKIEENDYTIHSYDDIVYEVSLLQETIAKRAAFVENQMIARTQTNLTPDQLEEFESVFRHFDEDASNTLNLSEFSVALSALGINYTESQVDDLHARLSDNDGNVGFEAYLKFLVGIKQDNFSPEQIREAFRSIAGDRSSVTRRDLELAHVPVATSEFLVSALPRYQQNGSAAAEETAYDFEGFLADLYG